MKKQIKKQIKKQKLSIFLILTLIVFIQGCCDPEEIISGIKNELQQLQVKNNALQLENVELKQKVYELEKQINKKKSNLNKMFN